MAAMSMGESRLRSASTSIEHPLQFANAPNARGQTRIIHRVRE